MTCSQPKMPIDINMNNFKGECKNCEFTYNYQDSTCTAKNKGDVIELSYDVLTRPSAYFNKISLDVEKVLLYSPSLHKYEGVHEDGELIIYHKGINTKLMACIPIKIDDDKDEHPLIKDIITQCSKSIIELDSSAVLNIQNYNLSYFMTDNPYIYYNSTTKTCNENINTIVFGNSHSFIPISKQNLNTIRALITYNNVIVYNNTPYYKFMDGAKKTPLNSNYVRCYESDKVPNNLPPVPETSIKEGFSCIDDIISDNNSININTILLTSLIVFGGMFYLREVITR